MTMTSMTDEEWKDVQEALVVGGLQACINDMLARRCPVVVVVIVEHGFVAK